MRGTTLASILLVIIPGATTLPHMRAFDNEKVIVGFHRVHVGKIEASPSLGDAFLSSVDASGMSIDMRGRLSRGDLIRVGHPTSGETFRVSTDASRPFTDKVIPLGSTDDSNSYASISFKSLQHSTYEVQSFYIRSKDEHVTLTPSVTFVSGYRIRFKSETTHTTTAGGANGCLKWDSSSLELKAELETLDGIDSVEVSREVLPTVTGGLGAGVKYDITFTGDNVRGNVPPIQIIDMGTNGCLDSHTLGGTFSADIANIAVEQVEIPYVPLYEVQTTSDIPYDASADDMKAAIESLSLACSVEVSREINRNGFSWDVTFVDASSSPFSPLLVMSANDQNLAATIDSGVNVADLQKVHISSTEGVPLFVRVAARNSYGTGKFVSTNPRAVEVSPQLPSEPIDVFGQSISDSEIFVEWNPPMEDGGWPVTHYKIEYDTSSSFTSGKNNGPFGSMTVSASAKTAVYDVQTVTVKIDKDELLGNERYYLSGTFSLSFDGQLTSQLPYNVSSERLKAALEELCNVNEVSVTRSIHCSPDPAIGCMEPEGYSWLVTFMSVNHNGDQHYRHTSNLSSNVSHKLSADSSYLFECSDISRAVCSIGNSAMASVGTVQASQSITIAESPFTVTIGGETSDAILIGDSLPLIEQKLNLYEKNGVGKIAVTCESCVGDVINSDDSLMLHFLSFRGDLPDVVVSDHDATVSEVTKGASQFVVGRSTYSSVISNLSSMSDWYVRVFAYNGVGEGVPGLLSSPLRLSVAPPQVPEHVVVESESSTSLLVSWDRPHSVGGVELSSFVLEIDTSPSFTTNNGAPSDRLVVSESFADTKVGLVSEAFPDSDDPNLRRRLMIDDVSLITQGTIKVGSELRIENQEMVVASINEGSCGVTCLTMDRDYKGIAASGMNIYSGFNAKQYAFSIKGLRPGVAYYVRVAATNESATGPFSFVGYPLAPVSFTPIDVPSSVSWASLSSIHSDELRLDYDLPNYENGSPASKYFIEIASSPDFRPQTVSITTIGDTPVDGFMELSIGYEGNYDMIVSVGGEASTFTVKAGSTLVTTTHDLTSTLHPRETILIADQLVEVAAVFADKIQLKECHMEGANTAPAFRQENYIGSAIITPGSDVLIESNGRNLASMLRPGDILQIFNDAGDKQYLTITATSASSATFTPSFEGGSSVTTPIYTKKKIIVSANASSSALSEALTSFPEVDSVEVERQGPNPSEGFTWLITFSSHMGADSCSLPSFCLTSSVKTLDYISVNGLAAELNGDYVLTSFTNGRPHYELLGKTSYIEFDSSNEQWNLYSSDASIVSSASSTAVSIPLSGWTNSALLTQSTSEMSLLLGSNAVAQVTSIQSGIEPSFTDVVYSTELEISKYDVQIIDLLSDEDNIFGTFELSFGASSFTVVIDFDESEDDLKTKLESSPLINAVDVEKLAPPPSKYGCRWIITFHGNLGDVPLLRHNGMTNLSGSNISLNIVEEVKGSLDPQHISVGSLEAGRMYVARIAAGNDAGYGPYTSVARVASTPPESPSLSVGSVTKSKATLRYSEPNSNGSIISSYKFEWTSSSFESLASAATRIACADGSDILGSIRFVYGIEKTVPIDITSQPNDVSMALNAIKAINEVQVSVVTNSTSEVEWMVTFLYDIGEIGSLLLDTDHLSCQSEDDSMLESDVTMNSEATLPLDYGSTLIYSDDACGGVRLDESGLRDETKCVDGLSKTVAIVASSLTPIGGSFLFNCGDRSSDNVSVHSSASEIKAVLTNMLSSNEVAVTKHEHSTGVTWAVSYLPSGDDSECDLSIVDTNVTGKNARVDVNPIVVLETSSAFNDSSGDFRIEIDGEMTSPISHQATQTKILQEMHQLDGIGLVEMLGPSVEGEAWPEHTMIVKAYTADLDSIQVIPESNWRGTDARLVVKPPSGSPPRVFTLEGLDKGKTYSVRAFARNSEGYGPPSSVMKIVPLSTAPSAPTSVFLF